jgi:hypothetical protein
MNERGNIMKVGDIVKSLDFVNISDCYYIGKVVGVYSDGTFRAQTIGRVWQGQPDKKFEDYFTAPQQGNHFADLPLPNKFTRVEIIG